MHGSDRLGGRSGGYATVWTLALLTGLAFGVAGSSAAIPEPAKADPRYALGYVVVTHYPGVRADGTGDATAGIQAAIEDAYADGRAVLFPAGTYLISDTLKCYEWNFWHAKHPKGPQARNPDKRNHVLIGSTLGVNRPLIKLAPNAALFADPAKPRPMLAYRAFGAVNANGTAPVEPDDPLRGTPPNFRDAVAVLFDSELRGLDFDCNGNPGAVGVAFRGAQDSSIENVRVLAAGATAGIRGIPGRNGGAANIEVVGGRYGLDLIDGGLAGTIAVGVRLTGQTERAIRNGDFCPLTVVGFHIVKEQGPVASVEADHVGAVGTLCLVDGTIELRRGGLAFDNAEAAKTFYARNVYVKGATELVKSGNRPAVTGAGAWSRIAEYAYTDQRTPAGKPPYASGDRQFRTFSLVNGELGQKPEPICLVEINAAPPPADLASRHVWPELPSYEGQADGTLLVTRAPYGAVPNDNGDDRAAIQAAIDAAEAAGHGRVFLPAGAFEIGDTLILRARTRLFGAGRLVTRIRCHESWQPTSGEPTMIGTVNDSQAETTLAFLALSARATGGGTNALGAHVYDRFNHIHWRAGRRSMIAAISLMKEWTPLPYANPHDNLKFTDSGGGRHYFLAPSSRFFGKHPACRAVRVVGTTEPLSFYGLNLELTARQPAATPAANVEMTHAANVRIYSVKREMSPPTLILRDCRNVALFGHGRQASRPTRDSGGHLQVLGSCDGVTIAPVLFDTTHGPNGEPTLREELAGGRRLEVIYPDGLSVYKRGELNDAVMWQ
ncbi:MAG: hypothetical protein JXR37_19180 [Kiritimatiellae bacterium]|nr:hypothetical protein [Kiritimatiellia bacterium]